MDLITLEINYWLLIPAVSALIGLCGAWLTGYILMYRVFPARRKGIADSLGALAARSFSLDAIQQKMTDPANIKNVMPVVETHIDDFLRNKLKEKMPMIGMLIGEKTINSLKEVFLKEIEEMFPPIIGKFAGNLEKQVDIAKIVSSRIQAITPLQLKAYASAPLRYLYIAGTLLGLLIGIVNTLLFLIL